jgi:hypothetical protein
MEPEPDQPADVYELSTSEAAETPVPTEWQSAAVYALELPARCPFCREILRTLRVLRLARTQVAFTSPLPRAGRVIVCPACERIISAELTGII